VTAVAEPSEPPSMPAKTDKATEPGHPSDVSRGSGVSARITVPALIDRRIAVAGAVFGFGLGLALGLKLASGMPKAVEVPVPTRTPCRNCAERERQRLEAARRNGSSPPPPDHTVPFDPVTPDQPVTFSPLVDAPAEMVAMAQTPTDADLPADQQ
jgi:hypothetical protein